MTIDELLEKYKSVFVNICMSMSDDFIKTNADFRYKAGLKETIKRIVTGKGCEWCRSLAGSYDYPYELPEDVYKRHDNCRCIVTHETSNGIQNVHSKRWKSDTENDILIPRSLSSAGRNYNVLMPDGKMAKLASGTAITKVVAIAGKGTGITLRIAKYLEEETGIKAEKWRKMRGEGIVRHEGKNLRVELHWYETHDGKNRIKMKVKKVF